MNMMSPIINVSGDRRSISISVDSNNLSFVNDLNPGKDMWNMKARIIRKWNQGYKMDLIFINEKGAKIQAGIKSYLIPVFDGQLQEDVVVILSKFGVGENKDLYKVVVQPYKINFYRCTTVTHARDWQGVEYGFNFRAYEDILQGEALNALSVGSMLLDLWFVVEILKSLIDLQRILRRSISILKTWSKLLFTCAVMGKVLRCIVWNDYALQIKNFISKIPPHEHVMAVIQHGKCKEWKCEYTVQSDKFATRIFLNEEIDEVNELRRSLILKFGQGSGSTSQTILSSQSVFPLHKEFVTDGVKKHVDEISEIEKEMSCVVVATIKIVQKSMVGFMFPVNVENVSDDIVRLPATSLVCPKCHSECTSITTKFKVQVRVQDESGSVSFVIVQSRVYTVQKTCDDPVITVELVGGDGNGDENTDEVTQEDAVSVTANSSAVEVEKDSGSSPNGKRMAQDADVVNVGELSTNVRRTRKKLTKVNN
ncbi:replication protein A 70 kDa DNA-binding subunit A-like [Helianthus annuus]|uniref:replication protein A 70 kDa DNA-binding subunit A-like n=1 Tax=Helianthus annuus TaxID=4232 RepID=UPI000B9090B8|nr:replication protein A 70 kDa DNA-binding subunit A-like [Helianthus annuus]